MGQPHPGPIGLALYFALKGFCEVGPMAPVRYL
jgi:hypothetical protein